MPFDGRNFGKSGPSAFDGFLTSQTSHRFDTESTRPTTQNSPLFGLDGAEWRGFFVGLTALLALAMGVAAMVVGLIRP